MVDCSISILEKDERETGITFQHPQGFLEMYPMYLPREPQVLEVSTLRGSALLGTVGKVVRFYLTKFECKDKTAYQSNSAAGPQTPFGYVAASTRYLGPRKILSPSLQESADSQHNKTPTIRSKHLVLKHMSRCLLTDRMSPWSSSPPYQPGSTCGGVALCCILKHHPGSNSPTSLRPPTPGPAA